MTAGGGLISAAIVRLVDFVLRRPVVTVIGILCLCSAGLYYTATGHLEINTDTADMISGKLQWRKDFIAYRESFPARDRNIVIVVDGETSEIASSYVHAMGDALLAEPELFPAVFLGRESDFFARNGILFMDLDELYDLDDRLTSAQPLLARLAEDTSGAAVIDLFSEALESDEALPPGTDAALNDMLAAFDATLAAAARGERRPVAWGKLLGSEFASSTRHLILVKPGDDSSRIPAKQAIDRIDEIRNELAPDFDGVVDVRLTGTPVMEYEELSSITESAAVTGFAALALVILVLLWFLRSLRQLFIAVVTLLAGLSLTASFAALTVGELNLLSVAFAVLYVGLGVDFILHLLLRLEELQRGDLPLAAAILETAGGVGVSLVICASTTAVGFFAFIPTDFTGISSLGLIAGGGMLISLLVSLSLLPALLILTTPERGRAPFKPGREAPPSGLSWRLPSPRLICTVAAVVFVAALWLLPPKFDGNPINLRDPGAESIRALNDLATSSEAPIFSLAVIADDASSAQALAGPLAGLQTVQEVQTLQSYVPRDQEAKLDVVDFLRFEFAQTLSQVEPAIAAPDRMFAAVDRLAAVLAGFPQRTAAGAELFGNTVQWLEVARGLAEPDRASFALQLDRDLRGNLVEELTRLNAGLQTTGFGHDDLPPQLRDRWINADGQQLVEVIPKENLNDGVAAEHFVSQVRSVAPNATGLPVVYEEAAKTVTRAFSLAITYAFVTVGLMLVLFLRNAYDTVMVMLPILFAAVVTMGVSVLIGLDLNFANIIALPLLIGIGVDSGIHVVHRMRTEPPADGNPLHTSTSRAVVASALTTVASFGNLAFATHVGMASMGQLLTLGMLMSLVSVLILLPALMRMGQNR